MRVSYQKNNTGKYYSGNSVDYKFNIRLSGVLIFYSMADINEIVGYGPDLLKVCYIFKWEQR